MTVKFEDALWAKVKTHAEAAGYPSPEQFVQETVMRQVADGAAPEEDQRLSEKLKSLGYLDAGSDI